MSLLSMAREVRDTGFAVLTFNRKQVAIEGIALTLTGMSKRMRYVLHRGHEVSDARLAASFITDQDRVLEIGAGSGFTALYTISRASPQAYALVEANLDLFPTIAENFALNGIPMPKLLHAAVGPDDGVVELQINREFWSSSILNRANSVRSESVPQLSIPSILAKLDFTPNVLAMDVEGAETTLPLDHLTRFEKLLIEFHPKLTGEASVANILRRLEESGYSRAGSDGSMVALRR